MPLAVRRVGGTEAGAATYTLGPGETFRLDAASFTIAWSNQGGFVTPVLQARNQGGDLIADIAAPSIVLFNPEFPSGFSYTGPAVMADLGMVDAPDGYSGYLLHDFGAGVTTSQITITWDAPSAISSGVTELALRSPGAVSIGAAIGSATVENTATVTVQLTSGIAAGDYLLLHLTLVSPTLWINPDPLIAPAVTDSVGGNLLDFSGHATGAFAGLSVTHGTGIFLSTFVEFYRIVNPLSAGDTVTLTLAQGPAQWMRMDVNDVTGLTVGNPIGPNTGGNFTAIGQGPTSSPFTSSGSPVPKWTGPVLINAVEKFPSGGSLDVSLARGETHPIPEPFSSQTPAPTYAQMGLPELRLVQGDTITATSMDETGPRSGDLIENFLIYGVDIAAG